MGDMVSKSYDVFFRASLVWNFSFSNCAMQREDMYEG